MALYTELGIPRFPAQRAAKGRHLGREEPDADIPPSGGGFIEEVQKDIKPGEHGF